MNLQQARSLRALLLTGASAITIALPAGPARAQSVDYGSLEQLYGEPVTTSATGKPQKVSEVPANMEIITQDDIRRSGADNLPDILQFTSGIDVRRYGFASTTVAVRGQNQPWNPRLLVLVNGRQVYSDDYDFVPWEAIPVELAEIRQIEIVKGPNSALFGFNAVSGVINIITYDPLYDHLNTVSASTGSQSLREGSLVASNQIGPDAGVRFSAGGYYANEYFGQLPYTNTTQNPIRGSVSGEGKWRIAPGLIVDLSASDVYSTDTGMNASARYNPGAYHTNSIRLATSYETSLGTFGLNVYRNEMVFIAPPAAKLAGQTATSSPSSWDEAVYVVQASDIFRVNDANTLRFGLEFRSNSLDTNGYGANQGLVNGEIGETVFAASAMWDWQINPQWSLTNAVRLDYLELNRNGLISNNGWVDANYNNVTHTQPSFNTGLVYKITDDDTARLTIARGVQVPSLIDLGSTGSGNPNIEPSIVMNYELGWDHALSSIGSVFRTSIFYETNQNVINRLGGPRELTPIGRLARLADNVGNDSETGIEIGFKGHIDAGFRWNASYSFESVTQNLDVNPYGVAPTSPTLPEKGTPQHVVILGGGYANGPWEVDGEVRWQSSYYDFNAAYTNPIVKINNFFTTSARVGYKVTENLTLALSGQQLAQDRVIEVAGPPVARRIIATATFKF